MPELPPALVLALGNDFAGDDAAGLLVARALRARREGRGHPIEIREIDPTRLVDAWTGRDHVVVVDAMRSGAPPGTVHRFDVGAGDLDAAAAAATFRSSHGFGLVEAIALARTLGFLPARLIVYGIEGRAFETGASLGGPVAEAARALSATLAHELG